MIKIEFNTGDKIELKSGEICFITEVIKQGHSFKVDLNKELRTIKYEDIAAQYILVERKIVHEQ
jgi:preprotein translocase subunit YajC